MRKFVFLISVMALFSFGIYAAEPMSVEIPPALVKITDFTPTNCPDISGPHLVVNNSNRRSQMHSSRRLFSHGDTLALIYGSTSQAAGNEFQQVYIVYSFDAGVTWTATPLTSIDLTRTYPSIDNTYNHTLSADPIGSIPFVMYQERAIGPNINRIMHAYDEMFPYALFTPVNIADSAFYEPALMVWGTGDTIWGTSQDGLFSKDLVYHYSIDHGANWTCGTWLAAGTGDFSNGFPENGRNGYGFVTYGHVIDDAANGAYVPMYRETTDYGQTWTTEQPFEIILDSSGSVLDTFGITWQGSQSVIIDQLTNKPYIVTKLDTLANGYSVNFGEVWFTKPNGGTPGAWTFDVNNPVPICDWRPGQQDNVGSFVQIGMYYAADSTPVLYIGYSYSDSILGMWKGYIAASTDEGNTWTQTCVTNDPAVDTTVHYTQVAPYVDHNGNIHMVYETVYASSDYTLGADYHVSVNVVTDLGLPAPIWPYPCGSVGVEENPVIEIPSFYRISTNMSLGNCSFEVGIPEGGMTSLRIYDATGRIVEDLVNRYVSAGNHSFDWNTNGIPSGNYIYRLTSNGYITTGKVLIAE